jgi:hypothetical protein
MLIANIDDPLPSSIHSSWPLESAPDLDYQHCGRLKSTFGAATTTLDRFIFEHKLKKIDFIKLDVDGNELEVLKGARESIRLHQPRIILELAPYVYDKNPKDFAEMLEFLWDQQYRLFNINTKEPLSEDVLIIKNSIPKMGGINAICIPKG